MGERFTAMVVVQEHPGVLQVGYQPIVYSRTTKVACQMTKILWKQQSNKKTTTTGTNQQKKMEENPSELVQYETAEIELKPTAPLFLEPFEKVPALGRIAVMDSNRLKMIGKVTGVT